MRKFFIATALIFLAAQPVQAASQRMHYEVYAGGINAVDAELDMADTPNGRYTIRLAAATKGFMKKLAPWSGYFETNGWRGKLGDDQPQLHRSVATWRGQDEVKDYSYDRKGNFIGYTIRDDENDGTKKTVDPALVKNTTDVLTATLATMRQVGKGDPCAGSADIFDGERRFTMSFRDKGEEDLQASRYNIYNGPAQRCDVEITPKGGKWYKKPRGWLSIQEQGRQHGMLPMVWFARMDKNSPAIPVKIMIKSDYGAMLMHLSDYQNKDTGK